LGNPLNADCGAETYVMNLTSDLHRFVKPVRDDLRMSKIHHPRRSSIVVDQVSKRFGAGPPALDRVSFSVAPGEMVGLLGASGSGKSTLIRTLCGLTRIDRGIGSIRLGSDTVQKNGEIASDIRALRHRMGVVFQQFNLVGQLSVIANVIVAASPRVALWRALSGRFPIEAKVNALEALATVGLEQQAWQRASTLSGGQQQRVALARTLTQGAEVLLADEPVASLDPESARRVMEHMRTLNQNRGMTVLVSLHQVHLARRYCPRIVALQKGRIVFDGPSVQLSDADLRSLYGSEAADLFGDSASEDPCLPRSHPKHQPRPIPHTTLEHAL
jgi:phosphonate transport system ATP-binding protein